MFLEQQASPAFRKLGECVPPTTQLSLVEILRWETFPIGITGKTLKRVFREKTEPHAVPEANRPVTVERRDQSPVARAESGGGEA